MTSKIFGPFQKLEFNDEIVRGQRNLREVQAQGLELDLLIHTELKLELLHLSQMTWKTGLDAAKVDLLRGELVDCNFTGARVKHSIWQDLKLTRLQMHGGQFKHSVHCRNEFFDSDLRTLTALNSVFESIHFRSSDLSYSTWLQCVFVGKQIFHNTCLAHSEFSDCTFVGIDFSSQDDLDLAQFKNCRFLGCSMSKSVREVFIKCNLFVEANVEVNSTDEGQSVVPFEAWPQPPPTSAPNSRFSSLEIPNLPNGGG